MRITAGPMLGLLYECCGRCEAIHSPLGGEPEPSNSARLTCDRSTRETVPQDVKPQASLLASQGSRRELPLRRQRGHSEYGPILCKNHEPLNFISDHFRMEN